MAGIVNLVHHTIPTGPYVASGHIRTALQHPDGVVVAFHDGTITAGSWAKVASAYPDPIHTVWRRGLLESMVAAADNIAAVQQAMLQRLVSSPDYQPR